ncbi:sensor histidine kinase [Idiomarina xiamenensis]|uniref:histidine kinase n=1 Tax=Idiomarina xiamenensis 10-D-4 TaxID=740709 RepID=K2L2Z1_9GAMM|nr:HAMP domain-containing sensor histidine kinase [Idiomarina xiamenensis]EKE84270.1 Signal transduction histidine kinase [Idiomarina xiamenensis 10-D-4]
MSESNKTLDFPTILASSAHDMKNSLCLFVQAIESLAERMQGQPESEELARLHYEAQRINGSLVQLLALYRHEHEPLSFDAEQIFIEELLEEVLLNHELYAEHRQIETELRIDSELQWYVDRDLLSNLLNDIVANALRYSADKLLITASCENQQLHICINDDGEGYPAEMLKASTQPLQQYDFSASRTGLGLFFAQLIAQTHKNQNGCGHITLANGGELGGGLFRLVLP